MRFKKPFVKLNSTSGFRFLLPDRPASTCRAFFTCFSTSQWQTRVVILSQIFQRFGRGQQLRQQLLIFRHQRNFRVAFQQALGFQQVQTLHPILPGQLEISCSASPTIVGRIAAARANSIAASTFGGAANNADLVGAVLHNRRSNLTQAVDDFFFDLSDHARVAEMHFADVNRAQLIAPFVRLGRHFLSEPRGSWRGDLPTFLPAAYSTANAPSHSTHWPPANRADRRF